MFTHCFNKELLRCSFITSFCNKAFQNLTFVINGAPKVKSLTIYLDEDFIQVPLPVRVVTRPPLLDFFSKLCTKSIDPKPHSFVADIDTALR